MTPETLVTPDMSRFVNNANDLVAFEAIVICVLASYIIFLHWLHERRFNKLYDTLEKLANFTEALNARKN